LIEETDYRLELKQGMEMYEIAQNFPRIRVPMYYPELSNDRVLSMEWIDGRLLPEFISKSTAEERQQIGQELWDFFCYQLKIAGFVHADPHPGNFMVDTEQRLVLLDFGCMKRIDTTFQESYLALLNPELLKDDAQRMEKLEKAGFINQNDSAATRQLLHNRMSSAIALLARPFHEAQFDFSSEKYFEEITSMGEGFAKDSELRKVNAARGSKDSLYIMRSFFGVYQLLHQLGAKVRHTYPLGQSL
jgi:predicted unusual protein kinase regulating ubiquinone biosynthesis (AarF/ABC1/UbiB family)